MKKGQFNLTGQPTLAFEDVQDRTSKTLMALVVASFVYEGGIGTSTQPKATNRSERSVVVMHDINAAEFEQTLLRLRLMPGKHGQWMSKPANEDGEVSQRDTKERRPMLKMLSVNPEDETTANWGKVMLILLVNGS